MSLRGVFSDLTPYVPYTGATDDVDLGAYGLTANTLNITTGTVFGYSEVVVSGSSTPSFSGTYVRAGTYNSYSYWECTGVGYIWKKSAANYWIISAVLGTETNNFYTAFVDDDTASVPPATTWNPDHGATGSVTTPITPIFNFTGAGTIGFNSGAINFASRVGFNRIPTTHPAEIQGKFAFTEASSGSLAQGMIAYANSGLEGVLEAQTSSYGLVLSSLYSNGYIKAKINGVEKFGLNNSGLTLAGNLSSKSHAFTVDTTVPSTLSVALAGAGAGNVDNGAHQYVVVFYTAAGDSYPSSAASVTVTDKTTNGQVSITNIPTSTRADIVGRKIYRSAVNGSYNGNNRWYLLTTIANNTTTTYTDNIADSTINTETNKIIFLNTDPTYYPTWDSSLLVGSTRYAGLTSTGGFQFINTSGNPYAWFNPSTSRLYLAHPTRIKNTVIGTAASIYMATDSNNSAVDAMYINAGGGGRMFLTATYAINLNGVPRFENFVPEVSMRASTGTVQGDGSTSTSYLGGGGNLIIYNGNFTGEITGSLAAGQMRSLNWAVYAKSTDGYVRQAGWTIRHGATSAEWTNPMFRLINNSGTPLDVMMTGEHRIGLNSTTATGLRVKAPASYAGKYLDFQTSAGTTLLKIESDGVLYPVQAATVSAPTYVAGGVYYDTTLNKLRVGGAAGWETITSV